MTGDGNKSISVEKRQICEWISLQAIVAIGMLFLLGVVIFGALFTGTSAEGSMDGFSKFQFKIFAANRDRALEEDSSRPRPSAAIPAKLVDRINRSAPQLVGAYVLWVDDGGALQNSWERRALGSLGVAIDTARDTDEAISLLQSGLTYDVVVTDFSRPNDVQAPCYPGETPFASAGCRLIQQARALCGEKLPPIIVYAANLDEAAGQPAYVLGMTNRFDQLVEFVLDGLERRPSALSKSLETGACARTAVAN